MVGMVRMGVGWNVGPYTVQRHVARGGMGDVWLAHRQGPAGFMRRVALKTLHSHLRTPAGITEFQREARLGSWLHHPNVVPVLDAGEHQGAPYLVMEWADGVDLRRLMARSRVLGALLPPALAAYVAHQVLCALEAATALKDPDGRPAALVHRDISPDNIMVGRHGDVRVTDFGLAREQLLPDTDPGRIKGKLPYMSPEHLAGLPLDDRSDLYSVGVVLHEMLCGSRPYEATGPLEALERARSPESHPLEVNPGLPGPLAELSWRWRQAWPQERAPTVRQAREDMGRALAASLSGVPTEELSALVQTLAWAASAASDGVQVVTAPHRRGCAKCGGTLMADTVLGGVIIDRCGDCHGVLLERNEQVRILGGEAQLQVTRDVHAIGQATDSALDGVRGECPLCGVPMDVHPPQTAGGFHVERCPHCQALWFDAGELEALVKGDVLEAVHLMGWLDV